MATQKVAKYPKAPKALKKPKANAGNATKENYLKRRADQEKAYKEKCKAVDQKNADRLKEVKKAESLNKAIAGLKPLRKK